MSASWIAMCVIAVVAVAPCHIGHRERPVAPEGIARRCEQLSRDHRLRLGIADESKMR